MRPSATSQVLVDEAFSYGPQSTPTAHAYLSELAQRYCYSSRSAAVKSTSKASSNIACLSALVRQRMHAAVCGHTYSSMRTHTYSSMRTPTYQYEDTSGSMRTHT